MDIASIVFSVLYKYTLLNTDGSVEELSICKIFPPERSLFTSFLVISNIQPLTESCFQTTILLSTNKPNLITLSSNNSQ